MYNIYMGCHPKSIDELKISRWLLHHQPDWNWA